MLLERVPLGGERGLDAVEPTVVLLQLVAMLPEHLGVLRLRSLDAVEVVAVHPEHLAVPLEPLVDPLEPTIDPLESCHRHASRLPEAT